MPTETKPQQLPMVNRRFEQIFHRDHRACSCELPMTSKKWNDALGTFVVIRLCCLAKALEKLTGLALYEVFHFDPKWQWDCDKLIQCEGPDGTVELRPHGPPPKWLLERMRKKGIEVKNLPDDPERAPHPKPKE